MGVTQELTKMRRTMRDVFGIRRLRPGQEDVIRSIVAGRDTLAIMPTGAGKSLCYQLPALHLKGTTVIVSPLISLMKDQVDKLEASGVEAIQVNSSFTEREQRESVEQIERGGGGGAFIFTTPERLTDPDFLSKLADKELDFVVIDESHCISEWGHDFRPSYLALGSAIKALGSPPVLALTATATPEVVADIQKQLGLRRMEVINTGIYRPNLCYEVLRVTNEQEKRQHVAQILRETEGTGVVYCATVKAVESLVEFFRGSGFELRPYHGKLAARERKENQELFMSGALKAMVATNAFGMGIDKPDIRFVAHYQMPGSLESYYQESGRAGRDGEEARCILLYQLDDRRTQLFFMGGRYPKESDIVSVYDALKALDEGGGQAGLSDIQERAAGVAAVKVRVILSMLKEAGAVREGRYSRFTTARADLTRAEVEELSRRCAEKGEKDREKLASVMRYGQSAECRWKLLHEYFGEEFPEERCDACDNCTDPLEEQLGLAQTETPKRASAPEEKRRDSEETAHAVVEIEFKKGDAVETPKHGAGRVAEVEGDKVTVSFPDGEKRTFKKEFVTPLSGRRQQSRER
ncbi:MAG: RecQ family ATP-dependent DNA helicase [Pyrinomonadaceae bacterium]